MRARAPLSKWMLTQIASDCTEVSWHTPFIVTEIRRYSSNWLSLPALPLVPAVKWHVVVLKGKGSDEQYCARKRSTTQCCEYRGCEAFRPVACQCANATGGVPSLCEAEDADRGDASSHP